MALAGATIESSVSIKLTSWKEIAQYLLKGVRTVQRWEHEVELPALPPDIESTVVIII